MYLITKWFGTFLINEKGVKDKKSDDDEEDQNDNENNNANESEE